MTEIAAEATGGSGQAQAGPGEWRIDDALVDTSPKMQIASLTATNGDLVLGVSATDDIVDQVASVSATILLASGCMITCI